MLTSAIPVIHVDNSEKALSFYCDKLGFTLVSTYRPAQADPAYCVLSREGATFHLSSFSGDGVAGNILMLRVDDIHALYDELSAKAVDMGQGILQQTWGTEEIYIRDPDGNSVRFQQLGKPV